MVNIESKFSGINVCIENTKAKIVFPAKIKNGSILLNKITSEQLHIHYDIELHFILSGSYLLATETENTVIQSGSVCIIPKGIEHRISENEPESNIFNMLVSVKTLKNSSRNRNFASVWNSLKEIQLFENADKECGYIRDFFVACNNTDILSEKIRENLISLAFLNITDRLENKFSYTSQVAKVCKLSCDGMYFDAELENFLMHSYKQKLSRKEVAKHLGVSEAQLGRIIKRNYGTNYAQLITSLRMAEAKKLILQGKTGTDIAKSLGYTTYNGYVAAFKRQYGDCPENMRKRWQKK